MILLVEDKADVTPAIVIIATGLVYTSVCTRLSDEKAEKWLNRNQPTGISSKWSVSKDKTFGSGEPNPCKCQKWPETHRHMLFSC